MTRNTLDFHWQHATLQVHPTHLAQEDQEGETHPVHILLIEDDPNDALFITRALGDVYAQNLVSVEDGVRAHEFLCQQGPFAEAPRPDLVLLDLNLPRKSGRELLSYIRSDVTLKSIPIIVVTAADREDESFRQYAGLANGYIHKSVDPDEFTKAIHKMVDVWLTLGHEPHAPPGVS